MKALVVDDDRVLADLVGFALRREGFAAQYAGDIPAALRLLEQESPDLIVLDVNLPGTHELKDGFDLCRHIRTGSEVPILLLTVRGEEEDIVRGLEAGADDYVLKPFSPRQLLARVQALMRRARPAGTNNPRARLAHEGLELDPRLRQVRLADGSYRKLTPLETRLLETLLLNAGLVLTTDDLISDVWGAGGASTEMLRQLVRRLRAKIEADPARPQHIQNLAGLGYTIGLRR